MVTGRPDLTASLDLAQHLYDGTLLPDPIDHAVLLDEPADLPDGLVRPRPSSGPELAVSCRPRPLRPRHARHAPGRGHVPRLRLDPLRPLLQRSYRAPDIGLSFLSGRDWRSLLWNVAKQYARTDGTLTRAGLFTDTDRPAPTANVHTFDDRDFERTDIQAAVLDHRWRSVVFQGHGKDDSINLGEFTICGLNPTAPRDPSALGPRCAYGLPCYKPEDKLVPLNQVRAAEVVLSACNRGPLSDLALYDPDTNSYSMPWTARAHRRLGCLSPRFGPPGKHGLDARRGRRHGLGGRPQRQSGRLAPLPGLHEVRPTLRPERGPTRPTAHRPPARRSGAHHRHPAHRSALR